MLKKNKYKQLEIERLKQVGQDMEETSWSMTRQETQDTQDQDSGLRLGGENQWPECGQCEAERPSQRKAYSVTDVVLKQKFIKWDFFPKLQIGQNLSPLWGRAEFVGDGVGEHT